MSIDAHDPGLTGWTAGLDRAGLEALWSTHERLARRIASAMLGSRDEVDDALASVLGEFLALLLAPFPEVSDETFECALVRATATEVLSRTGGASGAGDLEWATRRADLQARLSQPWFLLDWPPNTAAANLYEALPQHAGAPVLPPDPPAGSRSGLARGLIESQVSMTAEDLEARLLEVHHRHSTRLICRQVANYLEGYLAGRLRGASEMTVVDHLTTCNRCQELAVRLERLHAGADVHTLAAEAGLGPVLPGRGGEHEPHSPFPTTAAAWDPQR